MVRISEKSNLPPAPTMQRGRKPPPPVPANKKKQNAARATLPGSKDRKGKGRSKAALPISFGNLSLVDGSTFSSPVCHSYLLQTSTNKSSPLHS
jgi:hypothetical protein